MVRKMGPLSKIFGMLPGMGEIKDQISNIDEKEVDRIEAIIHSMTPAERDNPKIIDGSRRARIASGAGVEVSDVNGLVNRFFDARKMMSSLAGGKMPGHAGHARDAGHAGSPPPSRRRRRAAAASRATRPSATRRSRDGPAVDPAAAFGAGRLRRGRHAEGDGRVRAAARSCATASASKPLSRHGSAAAPQRRGAARRRAPRPVGRRRGDPHRAGARTPRPSAPTCWLMPGLVDAHCHVGLEAQGAVPDARAEEHALADRAAGALLLRDAGSPADTRWMDDRRRPAAGSSGPAGTSPGRSATCATTAPRSSPTSWSPRSSGRPPAPTAGSSWWGTGSTGRSVT